MPIHHSKQQQHHVNDVIGKSSYVKESSKNKKNKKNEKHVENPTLSL